MKWYQSCGADKLVLEAWPAAEFQQGAKVKR